MALKHWKHFNTTFPDWAEVLLLIKTNKKKCWALENVIYRIMERYRLGSGHTRKNCQKLEAGASKNLKPKEKLLVKFYSSNFLHLIMSFNVLFYLLFLSSPVSIIFSSKVSNPFSLPSSLFFVSPLHLSL